MERVLQQRMENVGDAIDRRETEALLDYVRREALEYLAKLDTEPAKSPQVDAGLSLLERPLPDEGKGALSTLELLVEASAMASIRSAGPRFFHFVIGGATPAALAADWWTAVLDQNAYNQVSSPLAARLEALSVAWLKDLLELPDSWAGVLTTGATMANVVGLAVARQWWGEQHGVDVARFGLAGLPTPRVFSSDRMHPSVGKALAMLGMGRSSVATFSGGRNGRLDVADLESLLRGQDGGPAIIVANAGEANTGDFDPIGALADLAREYGAWLHVDAAFGIFARVTPRRAWLTTGIEAASSVAADGHKWLNVPYDCGFSFVRDTVWLSKVFDASASYIERGGNGGVDFGNLGPEMSRRARAMAVWATLNAYGRRGYRSLVERCLDLAERLAALVDGAPDLERLADVKLNVVCFRYRPPGYPEQDLDELNRRLGDAIRADGRFYVGTSVYEGRVGLRSVIINWRTAERDVDLLVDVARELGAGVTKSETTGSGRMTPNTATR